MQENKQTDTLTRPHVLRPRLNVPGEILPSGLNENDFITDQQKGLVLPRRLGVTSTVEAIRGVFVPDEETALVTDVDLHLIEQYGVLPPSAPLPKRDLRSLKILGYDPSLFVANETLNFFQVESIRDLPSEIQEVLGHLEKDQRRRSNLYDLAALSRSEQTHALGENSYVTTSPGALERVALCIANAVDDPEIRKGLGDKNGGEKLMDTLDDLLTRYRTNATEAEFLPEMPDLVLRLLSAVEHIPLNRQLRFKVYDCLERITLPHSLQESIIQRMSQQKDLQHPLAFQLTTQLINHPQAQESGWLQEQQRQREALLDALKNEPQWLFDHYEQLREQSKKLVLSVDPFKIPAGKVGLEIEYEDVNHISADFFDYSFIPGEDVGNKEIRKNSNSLKYSAKYLASLSTLAHYLADAATHLSSLHIHLDKIAHPSEPDIGSLLGNPNSTIHDSRLKTWEIRGLIVPMERKGNRLDPATLAEAIHMYMSVSRETNPLQTGSPFHYPVKESFELDRAIWGHICQFLTEPEGRLAALKAVQHPWMLRAINPTSIYQSFDQESQDFVLENLLPQLHGEYQHEQIFTLMVAVNPDKYRTLLQSSLSSSDFQVRKEVLHAISEKPQFFATELWQTFNQENDLELKKIIVSIWGSDPIFFEKELHAAFLDKDLVIERIAILAVKGNSLAFRTELLQAFRKGDTGIKSAAVNTWGRTAIQFRQELNEAFTVPSDSLKKEVILAWGRAPVAFQEELKEAFLNTSTDMFVSFLGAFGQAPTLFREELQKAFQQPDFHTKLRVLYAWKSDVKAFRTELDQAFANSDFEVQEEIVRVWARAASDFRAQLQTAFQQPNLRPVVLAGWGRFHEYFRDELREVYRHKEEYGESIKEYIQEIWENWQDELGPEPE